MANEKNLKTPSTSEARERGRKGGKASAKKRREKAQIEKCLNTVLTSEIKVPKIQKMLELYGLENTFLNAMIISMATRAVNGSVGAFDQLMKLSTETKKDKYDIEEQRARIEYIKMQTKEKENNINGTENTESKLDKLMEAIEDEFKNG